MSTTTHTVPAWAFDGEAVDLDVVRGWVSRDFTRVVVVGASADRNWTFNEDCDFMDDPDDMEVMVVVELS